MVEWSIRKLEQIDKEKNNIKNDDSHDYHFEFTKEQMKELHENGELEVHVSEGGESMFIKFTYPLDETHNEDIMDLAKLSQEITKKMMNHGK